MSRMFLLLLWFLPITEGSQRAEPMFTAVTNSVLPPDYDSNPTQLNYGVAVTDVDHDGDFEIVVAGYNGPNLVLKYDRAQKRLVNIAVDERSSPYYALRDRQGNAIGVTACDIDGDGREEIYFLNTNNAFSGLYLLSVFPQGTQENTSLLLLFLTSPLPEQLPPPSYEGPQGRMQFLCSYKEPEEVSIRALQNASCHTHFLPDSMLAQASVECDPGISGMVLAGGTASKGALKWACAEASTCNPCRPPGSASTQRKGRFLLPGSGFSGEKAGERVPVPCCRGSGRYSIYIANYAYGNVGPDALIEMDPEASDLSRGILALRDVAAEAGVSKYTGGRGVSVGPILSSSASDIFCDNENGPNFLFHNRGDGTFVDAAASAGVDDPHQHGRGVALADFNRDGKVDIVYGNWNGPHRLYLQMSAHGKVRFRDIASPKFSMPSPVRTVITADFDNDQELEIFFNNIAYRSSSANRLFRVIRREHGDPLIEELNPGDALEPEGRGTGGVVTDFDGDGMLDLILSHGESMAQPLSVFRGNQGFNNNWLRVVPRTRFGAFARGAKVVLYTKKSGAHLRIIDGGSGYLCEMEPVAHFGLGKDEASSVEVTWPDGKMVSRNVASGEMNSVLEIPYPRDEDTLQNPAPLECGQGFSQQENGHCMDTNECIQFPFVCPRDKPVCVNTYGSYRCRTNKRCSRGYEPNEDGTACVGTLGQSPGPRTTTPTAAAATATAAAAAGAATAAPVLVDGDLNLGSTVKENCEPSC
ncbi:cartilage acidic protein 1 [Piliocolobus tephrosceles]|uniref:cartilage acidic protein 1 n=1 Tax=Piliocolobus tephrosceles TaxID=591936 RepID=UPI000E6B4BC2|nr:cartilage acidic protein 1 [Piliocolobus tephrosceles]